MILTNFLKTNAQLVPTKAALIMKLGYRTITLTYHDVLVYAQGIAALLTHHGLKKDDAVLIYAPNSPYWCCVFWGTLLKGCRIVPLTTQSSKEIIARIAQQTGAKIIFTSITHPLKLDTVTTYSIEDLPELVTKYTYDASMEAAAEPDDIIEILYTSGTTGTPKGVMLSHKNLYSNIMAIKQVLPLKEGRESVLSILPLSHIFEQTIGFLLPFALKAPIVYAHSPSAIRDLACQYHITKLIAVPEFLKILMSKIELAVEQQGKQRSFNFALKVAQHVKSTFFRRLLFRSIHQSLGGKLTMIASGGAPLDPELENRWSLMGMTILEGYGLSETSPIITVNTPANHRSGSVGKPLPDIQVQCDPTDGEILVKGPNIFSGYFNDTEKTALAFTSDGWFKTGDIGIIDNDGYVFVKGRKKYMIKGAGAQNIYPEDIEEVLNQIPGVKDSCVLGQEEPHGSIGIHAVLLLNPNAPEAQAIVDQANAQLATYQHITAVTVWPEFDFPRSATRKVKKEDVKLFLAAQTHEPQEPTTNPSRLVQLVAQLTGIDAAHIHAHSKLIADLKLDSLLRIELVARIEELFGVILEENAIRATTTIDDLEKLLTQTSTRPKKSKLKQWPRYRLVCLVRTLMQSLISLVMRLFVTLDIKGTEHIKNIRLPIILMPNHTTYLDSIIVTMALPWRLRHKLSFAAAQDVLYEEFGQFALLGETLYNSFPFPRKEHENIKQGLESMGTLLDQGFSVVVYPEGTMSKTGQLLPLKPGAGLIGTTMHATIIPIKIIGLQDVVPYGKFLPRKRGTVKIIFGAPISAKLTDDHAAITAKIAAALKELN